MVRVGVWELEGVVLADVGGRGILWLGERRKQWLGRGMVVWSGCFIQVLEGGDAVGEYVVEMERLRSFLLFGFMRGLADAADSEET